MRHCKFIENGCIVMVGTGNGGVEITAEEYQVIMDTIRNKPVPPDGYGYHLKTDLTWEQYELPAADPDPDLTAEEALEILMGGGANAQI